MTFEDWWGTLEFQESVAPELAKEMARGSWNTGQRELLLELQNAKIENEQAVIAGEMRRVKNFRSLL